MEDRTKNLYRSASPSNTEQAPPAREVCAEKPRTVKRSTFPVFLRIVISLVVLAVGIFLILFFVARAAQFDSIGSMLQHMLFELQIMWQRIIS